jgi:carboxylate-amine ligase
MRSGLSRPSRPTGPVRWPDAPALTEDGLRAAFAGTGGLTVGLEDELMLLDAETLDLAPAAGPLLDALDDPRFVRELPASQVEIRTTVAATSGEAVADLGRARVALCGAAAPGLRLAGTATHPFARPTGELSAGARYERIGVEYPWPAARGLTCGLHVHVGVGGAERSLAICDALRSYLPELAALAANGPFHDGGDTGLATLRPEIAAAFPRQGVPPAFGTLRAYVEYVEWGRRGGLFPDASHLWWETRLHPTHGTVELRVPDAQTRLVDVAGITAVCQALVALLAERFDAGERLSVHEHARIVDNRWRATRYGLEGWLVDLDSGETEPTRERVRRLIETLEPFATALGSATELGHARALADGNGAERQRLVAADRGLHGLTAWLADETERDPGAPVAG